MANRTTRQRAKRKLEAVINGLEISAQDIIELAKLYEDADHMVSVSLALADTPLRQIIDMLNVINKNI